MSIKTPPEYNVTSVLSALVGTDNFEKYHKYNTPLDKKGRYLPYDELRHRIKQGLDHEKVWALVKDARKKQRVKVIDLGNPSVACHYLLTPLIQKAVSLVDRRTTSASLELMRSKIGEEKQASYLIEDLIEDESISSSQLEGAATTTIVAKSMLKQKRNPRTLDEKMILGNYRLMKYVWENRHKPLSLELLLEMHKVGVENIDDDTYAPGHFRKTNDIHVVDGDNEIVHTPPDYKTLKKSLEIIAEWANENHEESDESDYLHPLIKAITLHFCIGYEHPFKDGNGRVARALFYWYLFKNEFAAFRYIAISVLLKKSPVQYGKSYLYTESDEMDLTYFIEHQSRVVLRAIENFQSAFEKAFTEIQQFNEWLFHSGLYGKLNEKQRLIFSAASTGSMTEFSIRNVEQILGCSYNTAATALNSLVTLKLFKKVKKGREWHYSIIEKSNIIDNWSTN